MGISNQFHFAWLDEAVAPVRQQVRASLPKTPQVLGVGEQSPSLFIQHLLDGTDFAYQACDLFPMSAEVLPYDMNDLSPLFGKTSADIVCLFRASYFINSKHKFLSQVKELLNPRGYLFIDLLIGSSALPVLDFRYGERKAAIEVNGQLAAYYQTSFYDDRLLREFPEEVEAFCRHARRWPLQTQASYLRQAPRAYVRDAGSLRQLDSATLGNQIKNSLPEENVFSLTDFEEAGFEILAFNARYFYPHVKKFNLYCFVAARLKDGSKK